MSYEVRSATWPSSSAMVKLSLGRAELVPGVTESIGVVEEYDMGSGTTSIVARRRDGSSIFLMAFANLRVLKPLLRFPVCPEHGYDPGNF